MRLTGTQQRDVVLKLYVFAGGRARCDALTAESCFGIEAEADGYRRLPGSQSGETRYVSQPELAALISGAGVLTILRGDLAPSAMGRDLALSFEDFTPLVPMFHSERSARTGAASTAAWFALLLVIPCYCAVWVVLRWGLSRHKLLRSHVSLTPRERLLAWGCALALGAFAGAVDYATADVIPMRGGEGGVPDAGQLHRLHERARGTCEGVKDVESARATAAAFWRGHVNPYTGLPVQEEMSPGNYTIETSEGKIAYAHYDASGARW